ncbi:MAG: LamG domain-containing protein, partial [Verrucomicrobiota bacterium]
ALLGRWQMNASTGTIVSSIPDATLSGRFGNSHGDSPSLTWTPAEGVDGALRLNAPGDRVEVPAPNFTHGFTVMGWIKPAALPFSPWERFLSNQFAKGFFLGRNDNTAQWRFIVNGSAGIGTMTGGNIAHGQWQHVCGSYDGSTARLFVNGIQVASQNVAAPATPIQPLYFGSENQTDPSLRGQIDEIRIYSGAVPPAQIASLYGEERALFNAAAAYTNWASSHGLSGSHGAAGADFDFDGTSNETEFALGLLPGDANSRFAIAHSGEPVTGLTLTWPSQPGLAFTIRSSSDLSDWTVIEATVPAASAPAVTTSWTTGPLSPITRFYRVELAPTLSR